MNFYQFTAAAAAAAAAAAELYIKLTVYIAKCRYNWLYA